MTVRAGAAGWLISLCGLGCVGCGGNATATAPEPPAQPDGGGASAGSGSSPDMPSQGGAASPLDPEPACSGPEPTCVPDCTSLERTSSECKDSRYRCPSGRVELDSCPPNACARRTKSCCSPTGHTDVPVCDGDGRIGDCPAGFAAASVCVPQGLGIEDCAELSDGQACASEELVCRTDRCGRNCYCEADASGMLRWQCWVNAC